MDYRIEQAAANHKAYAEEFRLKSDTSFICGVDWYRNHQWISVDEELPEVDGHGYSRPVLVRDEYGVLLIATYSGQHKKWNSVGPLSYHRLIVTHWMPIPAIGGEQ